MSAGIGCITTALQLWASIYIEAGGLLQKRVQGRINDGNASNNIYRLRFNIHRNAVPFD